MQDDALEKLKAVTEEAAHEAPATPVFSPAPAIRPRSAAQQSWGTAIAIVVIVVMVIVGAFYAWGKRIAENHNYPALTQ